jgi:hypothetical protein
MLAIATVLLAGGLAASAPGSGPLTGRLAGQWRPAEKTVLLLLPAGADRPEEKVLHPDAEGRFSVTLAAGVYHVAIWSPSASSPILPGITIAGGKPKDLREVLLAKNVSARVAVTDAISHAPISACDITWEPPPGARSEISRKIYSALWSGSTRRDGTLDLRVAAGIPLGWRVEAAAYQPGQIRSTALAPAPRPAALAVELKPVLSLQVDVEIPEDLSRKGLTVAVAEKKAGEVRFRETGAKSAESPPITFRGLSEGPKRCLLRDSSGRLVCYSDIELSADGQQVILAPHGVRIHGTVKSRETPLAGAVVKVDVIDARRASDPDLGASDPTGQDGRYEVHTFQTGELRLHASFPNDPGKSAAHELRTVTVSINEAEKEQDFDFPDGRIALAVTDAKTGAPVPEAEVEVHSSGENARALMTTADESGHFVVENFPVGTVSVVVRAEHYRQRKLALEVEANGPEIPVSLEPSPAIEGHVIDGRGQPVPGATVWWGCSEDRSISCSTTEADGAGHFEIDSVSEPVHYFAAAGYALGIAALAPDTDNTVTVPDPGPASAIVLGPDGLPAPPVHLNIVPAVGPAIPDTALWDVARRNGLDWMDFYRTRLDGTALVTSFLPPGRYEVFVRRATADDPPRSENISLGSIAVPSASPTILVYDPGPGQR